MDAREEHQRALELSLLRFEVDDSQVSTGRAFNRLDSVSLCRDELWRQMHAGVGESPEVRAELINARRIHDVAAGLLFGFAAFVAFLPAGQALCLVEPSLMVRRICLDRGRKAGGLDRAPREGDRVAW